MMETNPKAGRSAVGDSGFGLDQGGVFALRHGGRRRAFRAAEPSCQMPSVSSLLPFGLALIMAHVGLTLTGADFARLAAEPKAVLIGLAAQMLALPLLAFGLIALWPLPPELALGVVLIAAAPGGATSNLLTLLAGGDVALAVTITAISTIASAATLPALSELAGFVTQQGLASFSTPVGLMMRSMLIGVVAPLLVGMAARRFAPRLARRIEPPLRLVSIAIFAAIVAFTFISNAEAFRIHGLSLGPAMLLFNLTAMGGAVALAFSLKLTRKQSVAVAFETGLQNAAVAIVVAVSVLGRPELATPAVIYAFCMNIGALLALPLARRLALAPLGPVARPVQPVTSNTP